MTETIVRLLARCREPLDSEWGDCVLCSGEPDRHASDCPWRLARAWVAAEGSLVPVTITAREDT